MPVIINDFEIEVEPTPPPQSRGGDSGEQSPASSSKLKPEEITTVMRVSRERMERVRAD
jgi:hypothetical protein